MKKKESTLKNMLISLVCIAVISASCIAVVYELTKKTIEDSEIAKKQNSIKAVLPDFDKIESIYIPCIEPNADSLKANIAYKDNTLAGIAIETYTKKGFSGEIHLMAGFLPDGSIYKISVLSHAETPGLGSKMTSSEFYSQFEKKTPRIFKLKVKQDGGEVDAITAATISSRAYCDAIERAFDAYFKLYLNNNNYTTEGVLNEK